MIGTVLKVYSSESAKNYHQFVDACLGKAKTSAAFSCSSKLTELIFLGVIAVRFPDQPLYWNRDTAAFAEDEANQYLDGVSIERFE